MNTRQTIADKLSAAFSPSFLNVIDESEKHKGHGGWREGGQTHFRVQIAAAAFEGMNRVARHRAVNDVLAHELENGVHALALEIRADSEPDPRAIKVAE